MPILCYKGALAATACLCEPNDALLPHHTTGHTHAHATSVAASEETCVDMLIVSQLHIYVRCIGNKPTVTSAMMAQAPASSAMNEAECSSTVRVKQELRSLGLVNWLLVYSYKLPFHFMNAWLKASALLGGLVALSFQ